MISLTCKEDCCGCNACGDICLQNAISFQEDNEGFWYPQINKEKCTGCGLCDRICPIKYIDQLKHNDLPEPECYMAEHKSIEVVFSSTSGGMFSALADVMYRQHGYVGGAIHNEDFSVSHFISNEKSDIIKLRRSKDLQSNAEGFYKRVREILNSGEQVLVCGVPCQMAALRSFLGKDYKNLMIVDLICLGVNSPKVWRKYLDYIEEKYKSKIVYTENKSKEYGWRNLTQKFIFENGEEAFDVASTSAFIKGYVGTHLFCRPSCYDCKFKGFPRISDITIGDFWGIEKYDQSMDKDLGVSVMLINSSKGKLYFEKASKRIFFKQVPLKWVISGNPALSTSITKTMDKRDMFFRDLDNKKFDEVIEQYSNQNINSWRDKFNSVLRWGWNYLKFVKKIVSTTRLNPKALYQTIRYSGIKNLLGQKGILCGTNCVLNISKRAILQFDGLLVLGEKTRFPNSKLETRLLVANSARLTVKGNMYFAYGCDIEVFDNAELILHGSKYGKSDTNIGCTIICGERIEIMFDVGMGRNVLIRDNNGKHYMNTLGYKDSRPIIIGEKAWLCEACAIMPGVKVGRGAIVGAYSMATQSVPAHTLVSGSPAKVVSENVLWKC